MIYRKMKSSGLFSLGDVNGFFGLISDSLANLSLATILLMIFDFPKDVIFSSIYPGIVLVIFLGNTLMTIMGIRLARRTGSTSVTAMPYGLDAPTTISMPLIVVGPTFVFLKGSGIDPHNAAIMAWHAGMAAAVVIGVFKIFGTAFANTISKIVPLAGLLGSLAGIGFMIGIFALKEIFSVPVVGIISLGFVLYVLIARIPLPKGIPGVLVGVVVCTLLYHILGPLHLLHTEYVAPVVALSPSFPFPTLGFLEGFKLIVPLLPAIIPFGILVTIGDINVTVSANEAGDAYIPRNILFADGIVTVIGAFFGSITQTTAYAGQPAYKHMGCKIGYTLYSAVFIGICGLLGVVSFIIQLIPVAILAPILIFVAIEIVSQGFAAVPKKHLVATAFAMFPSALKPMVILLTGGAYISFDKLSGMLSTIKETYHESLVLAALVNGFILTGMLWGGLLAEIINRRLKISAVYLFILALFSFFGVVHSVDLNGIMYFPWALPNAQKWFCYDISLGYLLLGIVFLILSLPVFKSYISKEEIDVH